MEPESDGGTNYKWSAWNGPQKLGKETERARNQRTNRDHLNYHINKIGQNTEKNFWDLRIVAVT